jgi:hypothetical protein
VPRWPVELTQHIINTVMKTERNNTGHNLGLWLACLFCLSALAPVAQAQLATPTRTSPRHGALDVPTTVDLCWQPVTGAVAYEWRLLRNGTVARNGQVQGATTTRTTLQNLYAAQTYTWQIRALGNRAHNHSPWSNQWRFTTLNTVTLLAPANGAENVSSPVLFSWSPLNGVSRYEHQISASRNFPYQAVTQTRLPSVELSTGGMGGETRYWRVRAVRDGVVLPWSSVASFRTANNPQPPVEGNIKPPVYPANPPRFGSPSDGSSVATVDSMGTAKAVRFSWEVDGAAPKQFRFELYQGKMVIESQLATRRLLTTADLSMHLDPLQYYTWRVGNEFDDGRILWSSTATFTTQGYPIHGLNVSWNDSSRTWTQAGLSWNSHRAATAYEVEVIVPSIVQRYRTPYTSFIVDRPATQPAYWRVRAIGTENLAGPWSQRAALFPAIGMIPSGTVN